MKKEFFETRCTPLARSHIWKRMAATPADRNGARPTNAFALERSPTFLRGPFFSMRNSRFGGVGSQKSRPKTPDFPQGTTAGSAGTAPRRISEDLRAAVPNTKFCTRSSLAQDYTFKCVSNLMSGLRFRKPSSKYQFWHCQNQ